MNKTTYQTPEIRDANDNIVQQGAFGKNTALSNATNNGWTDYVVNDLEALHDSIGDITSVTTAKTETANVARDVWFADSNNTAGFCKDDDFTYNAAIGRLDVPTIRQKDSFYYPQVKGGWYADSGSNVSGRIIIKPPITKTDGTGNNRYMYFCVCIEEYSSAKRRCILHIGGMVNTGTLAWSQTSADWIGGTNSVPVTFGNDGNVPFVAIGEATTKWTYPKVTLFNYITTAEWLSGSFDISRSTAEIANVSSVIYHPSITEPPNGTISHNTPYGGKSLGTSVTAEQLAEIRASTFRGINIGDYWEINSNTWYVAGINYFYGKGSSPFTTNHVVVVPRRSFYAAKMHTTATTDGGYVDSDVFAGLEENALPIIEAAFGAENILSHSVYLPTTCVDGEYTGNASYTRKLDLLSSIMVYGLQAKDSPYSILSQNTQLPLFFFQPSQARSQNSSGSARAAWLYDVSSATNFRIMGRYGTLTTAAANASDTWVRPYFCLG